MMDKEFNKIIGKELMLLRKDCDFSNQELSKLTNISASTISRYENGNNNMNLDIISKIVNACDTSVYIFFSKCVAKMQNNLK